MNLVTLFDAISLFAIFLAVIIVWKHWKSIPWGITKLFLAALLGIKLYHDFSNVLEWSGITSALDVVEDYIEILVPLIWGAIFYVFLQEIAKRDLYNSREQFRSLVESSLDWIWEVDREDNFVYASPRIKSLLGYEPEEVLGKSIFEHMPPDEKKRVMEINKANRVNPQSFRSIEVVYLHKEGKTVILEANGDPIIDQDGKWMGFRGISRDITERKREEERKKLLAVALASAEVEKKKSEELAQAYEALKRTQAQLVKSEKLSGIGQLAAGVAHELNSPLSGLLSLLKIYRKKTKEDSKQNQELLVMIQAAEYMSNIIKGLTSFARDSRGEFTELSLNVVLESTLIFTYHQLVQKKIEVIRDYAADLLTVNGDRSQLQQVVLNMITNACDAMPEGGKLVITTKNSEDENESIIEFIDNGMGIERENLPKIFDPFFTTKGPGKGVGLGLSISHGIIKEHNGEILVESQPGQGAKFTVILPKKE